MAVFPELNICAKQKVSENFCQTLTLGLHVPNAISCMVDLTSWKYVNIDQELLHRHCLKTGPIATTSTLAK